MKPFVSLFLLLLPLFGSAQTVSLATSSTFNGLIEPELLISELNYQELKIDARLAGGISGPLELGFGVSYRNTFGPLGNLLLRGQADILSDGHFQSSLQAEGVIAAIAAKAEARAFNLSETAFRTESAFSQKNLWGFSDQFGVELALSARYRLDRSSILDANLDLIYVSDAGLGAELGARYNLIKLLDRDDGAILAKVYGSPGFAAAYAALGFAYNVNRSDWPDVQAEVWLGANAMGLWPGLLFELTESLNDSQTELGLSASLEPYLLDQAYFKAYAYLEQTIDPGRLRLSLGLRTQAEEITALLKLSYSFDVKDFSF